MQSLNASRGIWVGLLALLALSLVACAQKVGDIDRTQANALRKADFEGEWYIRQTVTDVPSSSASFFTGYTFDTERIRWEITESHLIAYRSYELIPNLSNRVELDAEGNPLPSGVVRENFDPETYLDQPIAAFTISSHFDVQRAYFAETGEQLNVIEENTTDREWWEREYFRVDWAANVIESYSYFGQSVGIQATFTEGMEYDNDDAMRMVYDQETGELSYFDFVHHHALQPELNSCFTYLLGYGHGDCAAQRVKLRTSVLRVPEVQTYEPVYYSDQDMSRFGYFRTERMTYDRGRGTTLEGRILLANRHDIWEDSFVRGEDGRPLRDGAGRPVSLPFAERTPKPIVYHLNYDFPSEMLEPVEWLDGLSVASATVEGWDRAFRRAVAAAQFEGDDTRWEEVPHMFLLCHNPVQEAPVWPEDAAYGHYCGEVGERPLIGDLRYHFKYWVNNPQLAGPLGYGPSAADPITGQIISGTAYMYGAGVDTFAQQAVDLIRYVNGDLTSEMFEGAQYVRDEIRARRDGRLDPRGNAKNRRGLDLLHGAQIDVQHLQDVRLLEDSITLLPETARQRVEQLRHDVERGNIDHLRARHNHDRRIQQRVRETGFDELLMDDEWVTGFGFHPGDDIPDEIYEAMRPAAHMESVLRARQIQRSLASHQHCVIHADAFDDALLGIAEAYAGRRDYDQIFQEMRGFIYKSVQEHEIGHTVGLRHNFSGSSDVLNYFDGFWDARRTGMPGPDGQSVIPFQRPTTFAQLFQIAELTEEQIQMRMREYQYSSIMDYSSGFHTDIKGVGRYDEAAVVYAYTFGADRYQDDPAHPNFNTQQRGFVEVWDNPAPAASQIIGQFENIRNIGYRNHFDFYHYTTLVDALGGGDIQAGVDQLRERSLMRLDDLRSAIDADDPKRPLEVPYLFCSDEFRGSRQNCRLWDRGADPLEQARDYMQRYRMMHYFDNYRRDRLGWQASTNFARYYDRYFLQMVDTYQRWLLNPGISSNRPDEVLDNQWFMAALAGLNLIAEVMKTPSSGSYVLERVDIYDDEGNRIRGEDQYIYVGQGRFADADLYLEEGIEGRPRFTRYDGDMGYHYYKYPTSAGHFWTYLGAVLAMTSAQVSVVGVENLAGFGDTQYIIPPYLVFDEEITSLFNGIFLEDYNTVGPLSAFGAGGRAEIRSRPLLTAELGAGSYLNPETGASISAGTLLRRMDASQLDGVPINHRYGFSERLYAALYGMASFTSNYSLRFPDQMKIFRLGSGEALTAGPGFEVYDFCDAASGECYAAFKREGEEPSSAAALLIQRARSAQARALGGNPNAQREVENTIEQMNMMRSLYQELGRNF